MPAIQDFGPFWAFTIAAPASARVIGQALLARIQVAPSSVMKSRRFN
jgi:hypothetical protein